MQDSAGLTSFDFSEATEFEMYWNPMILRNSKSSDYFHIYGGVNDYLDCINDDFFLKSSLFMKNGRGANPGKVKFFELLLNGSKNILTFENHYAVKIKYTRHDKFYSATPVNAEIFHLSHLQRQEFSKTEQLARLAIFSLVDDKVSHILQVASLGNNFINLFKILETIKADENSKESGFALSAEEMGELKRFEYTANSPAVIGIYARHGVDEKKFKPAKTLVPMSLAEGHKYISSIFIRYINSKYQNYPKWN
ncbi:MAG: hypothetical protein ACK4OE_22360 [Acidovorax sp.]|uniref:hypothetical protein n=1 Tax=Acidovorax sp. TaxID=1872122 RepID=UPI003918BFAC